MIGRRVSGDGRIALFDGLYDAYYQRVYAYLLGHVQDVSTAEDLLQETFLRVWRRIETAQSMEPQQREAWLFTVARNLMRDQHRRDSVRARATLAIHAESDASGAGDPASSHLLRETVAAVDRAVARLPLEQRVVLSLQAVGGMNSREIGAALGRPAGTVRYQLSRARRRIADALGLGDEVRADD